MLDGDVLNKHEEEEDEKGKRGEREGEIVKKSFEVQIAS
jgi:hypothetical protein